MKRREVFGALVGAIATGASTPVLAQATESEKASLLGFPGMQVVVEDLPEGAKTLGLDRDRLVTDVELKLRQSRIRVLSEDVAFTTPGIPTLYVRVNVLVDKAFPTLGMYGIGVEFRQLTRLVARPQAKAVHTATWELTGIGRDDAPGIRQQVKDYVDRFLNDYLAVAADPPADPAPAPSAPRPKPDRS